MKVAITFDWLSVIGGAERVLAEMVALYPTAHIYAVMDTLEERAILGGCPVTTSFIQRLPWARKLYRRYLPLMPLAVEQWDLGGYDLILSSSHSVAKGVISRPGQTHVAYIHTPMRYAWDQQEAALGAAAMARPMDWLARWMLHRLRLWDQLSGQRPDHLIANSAFVAARIRKAWRREAQVIHPPVAIDRFTPLPPGGEEDFYLSVSRLVPAKRIELLVRAFSAMPQRRLVVIGDGPDLARLRRMAGPNVTLLGRQPDAVVADHLSRCRAFVIVATEDFGIAPLEAQAAGRPVIALGQGGVLESLVGMEAPDPTALFFSEPTPQSLAGAIERFEANQARFTPQACRANAERFAPDRFRAALSHAVECAMAAEARGGR
jgi:glycosyltransferase involved in cell wall biosynthesis